jgi:hypothetical protein
MPKLEREQAIAAARQTIQQEVETLQALHALLGEQLLCATPYVPWSSQRKASTPKNSAPLTPAALWERC